MESISTMTDDANIPIIRLDDPKQDVLASTLRKACIDTGFFYLQGHGISSTLMDNVLKQTQKFFRLSSSCKFRLTDRVLNRGYTGMGDETLDPANSSRGDTKEGYYIARSDIPTTDPRYDPRKLLGPNVWPTVESVGDEWSEKECEEFKTVMETYSRQMSSVALQVMRLLALALGLPDNYFDSSFLPLGVKDPRDSGIATLRLLHYSSRVSDPASGVFGCGAHSDYGALTLLLTDNNPGLQVLKKTGENKGQWLNITPIPYTFVVNVGDMLERWTNGVFLSTVHRVLTVPGNTGERHSIPFFYEPLFDAPIEPLLCCVSAANPAKYPPTTAGRHLLDKYRQTFASFQPAEDALT